MRAARRSGLWWRVVVVAALSVVGAFAALGCLLRYLLLGLAGAHVQGWEPLVWPLGVVVSIAVPVMTGWWLLTPRFRPWVPILMVIGVAVGMFTILAVLSGMS